MTKRLLDERFGDVAAMSGYEARGAAPVITQLAAWLAEMVRHYDSREWTVGRNGLERTEAFAVSAFHGRPLSASIESFLRRIYTLAKLEESVILVAAVYLQRIVEKCPGLPISSCTVHRLLLAAITVAAKFTLDRPRSNKVMASFVGMPPKKFNQNEVKFLCLMQYDLNVSPGELESVKSSLGMLEPAGCEPVYKKVKLGESGGTTYSTIDVLAAGVGSSEDSEADEMSRLMEQESHVDAMSHGKEMSHVDAMSHAEVNNNNNNNNIMTTEGDVETIALGVRTPCLSDVSATPSPGWSNASGRTPQETPPLGSKGQPVRGFLHSKSDSSSPEPTKMSTPERQTALGSLVAVAAE